MEPAKWDKNNFESSQEEKSLDISQRLQDLAEVKDSNSKMEPAKWDKNELESSQEEKSLNISQRLQDLAEGNESEEDHSVEVNRSQREVIPADQDLPPKRIIKQVYNFAAIVNKSKTLSNLVKMGVDLSQIEKDRDATDKLVRLHFENDVKPVVLFFHDVGMTGSDIATLVTKYPKVLCKSLDEMRQYVDYFRSKNFSGDSIVRIICNQPQVLELPVVQIDRQLGIYQKEFKLTGSEVREAVTKLPKLLIWEANRVKETKFYMQEFLGFSKSEIKEMFLSHPKVLLSGNHQLGKRFDYLYNVMKITHKAIVAFPRVFRTRVKQIEERHLYLKSVGRDQYDPSKENYVSLHALTTYKDRDFCFHLAKTSVSQYNAFLKTL